MNLDHSGRTCVSQGGSGLFNVMQRALQVAGLGPEQIDYITRTAPGRGRTIWPKRGPSENYSETAGQLFLALRRNQ